MLNKEICKLCIGDNWDEWDDDDWDTYGIVICQRGRCNNDAQADINKPIPSHCVMKKEQAASK